MLEEEVGRALIARGLTVATAESCTGGLVSHRLTNVSGSSAYLLGGVVAYANEAKERLLGVQRASLERHGAVSEVVALEMARGACERLGADVGVSTTGIAGPTGGTPAKPVGLVYVAVAGVLGEAADHVVFPGDRIQNKEDAAELALRLLMTRLLPDA